MIEAKSVSKVFDGFTALDRISCTIPEGCIYGMVGTNGAGKSTLLRLLTGVYKPDGGSVFIEGEEVYENTGIKNKLIFVADELYFLPGADMNRMSKLYESCYENFDRKRYEFLVKSFGLDPKKNLATFSKGMRRQASIILAISCRPKYMFFDETFDGLDPVMRKLVKGLICEDVEENKSTAVLTSHSLRELEDTCDQLALLHKGGIVIESDISNLKGNLFKVQVAFAEEYDKSKFEGIEIIHMDKQGSVANLIVKGEKVETVDKFRALSPLILDVLPLTLEEVFTYEVEALGYEFSNVFREEESDNEK